MTKLEELRRLWRTRDEAVDAWRNAAPGERGKLATPMIEARLKLARAVEDMRANEVFPAPDYFWDIDGAGDEGSECWEDLIDGYPEGQIVKLTTAMPGPTFFAVWTGQLECKFKRHIAPTKESLEAKMKEAGDVAD